MNVIENQIRLLQHDEGITIDICGKQEHGKFRGYDESRKMMAIQLDGVDEEGRPRTWPIEVNLIDKIKADEDVVPGHQVHIMIKDFKTGRGIPIIITEDPNDESLTIQAGINGKEIETFPSALYLRMAAVFIEHFTDRMNIETCELQFESKRKRYEEDNVQ